MNKSKAEPVISWCYPRQAESIKMHQREVWSLIFIVFGACLVKAEVQEDQANKEIAREDHPDHLGRPSMDEEDDGNVRGYLWN